MGYHCNTSAGRHNLDYGQFRVLHFSAISLAIFHKLAFFNRQSVRLTDWVFAASSSDPAALATQQLLDDQKGTTRRREIRSRTSSDMNVAGAAVPASSYCHENNPTGRL